MTEEQKELLELSRESLDAARLLHAAGHHGFAASRAYYAMFYAAEALLLGKGLAFSKHSGVIAAFGKHWVKAGLVPPEYHRHLLRAFDLRNAGDYSAPKSVTPEESAEQIDRARQFLEMGIRVLRGPPRPA